MKRIPLKEPEIFTDHGKTEISFYKGQSQELTPVMDWLIKAKKFINYYNALPKAKRGNLYFEKYPDQNSCYELEVQADPDANGWEDWLEVVPLDHVDDPWGDYCDDNKEDLTIVQHEYIHEGGPITDWYCVDWRHLVSDEEYNYIQNLKEKQK